MTSSKTHLIYDSFPYPYTHPISMAALGTVMGLKPAGIEKARILEIGCASGSNIIPIAFDHPHAKVVGVDISKQDIELGQKHIKELGLKNISLLDCSVEDFAKSNKQTFDYVICHGVFSWVAPKTQKAILQLMHDSLDKNGMAYVSYNTYPGWHGLDAFKHMAQYHSKRFDGVEEKITQSYALFDFLLKGISNKDHPYPKLLKQEIEFIESHPPSYVEQELLGEHHQPLYFHEFIDKIHDYELTYVGDVSLHFMYLENFPEEVRPALKELSNDIIRFEQYADFIANRRFRNSILCKHSEKLTLNRNVSPHVIEPLHVFSRLNPSQEADGKTSYKNTEGKVAFTTDNPVVVAMLQILHEAKGKTIPVKKLVEKTNFFLNTKKDKMIEETVLGSLLQLYIGELISLYSASEKHITKHTDKPNLYPFARHQLTFQDWVTNCRHEKVAIGEFERKILPLCDGTRTERQVVDAFIDKFLSDEANEEDRKKMHIHKKDVREQLTTGLTQALEQSALNALLTKNI
jgi:methyltransferase-like protein/ubiquinone/menaquinone biosynthesis C-methylase UbiE